MALAQLNDNIIVCMCVNNIIRLLLYKICEKSIIYHNIIYYNIII